MLPWQMASRIRCKNVVRKVRIVEMIDKLKSECISHWYLRAFRWNPFDLSITILFLLFIDHCLLRLHPPKIANSHRTHIFYMIFFLYLVLDSSWNTCSFKKKKKRPKLFVVKSWMILSSSTLHSRVIN